MDGYVGDAGWWSDSGDGAAQGAKCPTGFERGMCNKSVVTPDKKEGCVERSIPPIDIAGAKTGRSRAEMGGNTGTLCQHLSSVESRERREG